jgi:predicted dehydrogenase
MAKSGDNGPRTAVIGCGYWGAKHVRVLTSLAMVGSVVAVDSDPRRRAAIVNSVPGVACFSSLEHALPAFEAAIIATPPTTHAALALRLIETGRHVLVEKPLATTVRDARRVVEAADAAGVVLMVGHTFKYHAAVWKLREMVQTKEIGDLYYIDTARLNLGLYQSDVNVIADLAPHDISISNYILDRQPVAVESWGARNAHWQFEDVAYLRLHYSEPNVFANIHVSWLDPCKVRRVTVVGSRKMVVYNDLSSEDRLKVHDKGVLRAESPLADDTQPPMSYRYGDVVSPYLTVDEPLAVEDGHFIDCIRDGLRPITDGREGLSVVEALEAAQMSLVQRRVVYLSELDEEADASRLLAVPMSSSNGGSTSGHAGEER